MINETIDSRYPIEIPIVIKNYKYVRKIGSGAFSVVVLLENTKNGKQFAAKVVSRDFLLKEGTYDRFEQEIRLLQTFEHKNIVKVEDIIFDSKLIFVVMEYCSNGELYEYIVRQGTLPEPMIRKFLYQISSALVYLHQKHIAHRDIKPENILIDENFDVKLVDFGLCHITSKDTMLSTPCGSPFYAPPEVILGIKYEGECSDMWSLGVVLFAMCTGALPWRETNQNRLLKQIAKADFTVPVSVAPHLKDLIIHLMDPNPSKRPTAKEIVEIPWLNENANDIKLQARARSRSRCKHWSLPIGSDEIQEQLVSSHGAFGKRRIIVRPEVRRKKVTASVELSPILGLLRKTPNSSHCAPVAYDDSFNT